jgi:hypothetical protein
MDLTPSTAGAAERRAVRFEADNPAHPYSSTSLKLRERLRGHPAIEDRIERW